MRNILVIGRKLLFPFLPLFSSQQRAVETGFCAENNSEQLIAEAVVATIQELQLKQARKPRSFGCPKLLLSHSLTGVISRATNEYLTVRLTVRVDPPPLTVS